MVGENITKKLKPRIGKKILYECGTNSYKRTIKFHQLPKRPGCFSVAAAQRIRFSFPKLNKDAARWQSKKKSPRGYLHPEASSKKRWVWSTSWETTMSHMLWACLLQPSPEHPQSSCSAPGRCFQVGLYQQQLGAQVSTPAMSRLHPRLRAALLITEGTQHPSLLLLLLEQAICTSQGPAASPCSSCEPASPSPAKISFWQGAAQRSSRKRGSLP